MLLPALVGSDGVSDLVLFLRLSALTIILRILSTPSQLAVSLTNDSLMFPPEDVWL